MIQRRRLHNWLDEKLQPNLIKDYCPNGLQVEGKREIRKVVTGVTASRNLIEKAIAIGADCIIVHHGYFWKGEASPITGMKRERIGLLIEHNINLFAYHLPLDVHPELGNNAQLGQLLGFNDIEHIDFIKPTGVLQKGSLPQTSSLSEFGEKVKTKLGRTPLLESGGDHLVQHAAWCTGGGQGYIESALAAGVDTFITGEVSEQTIHVARECGIHFIAAGHHATERYGVRALGEALQNETGIEAEFIDVPNPA